MSMNNPYSQYQESQLSTATPGKLLVMTFDAAIRFAKAASEAMKEHKLDVQSANITKVNNILLELISTLDFKVDFQLADNLDNLYRYMFDRLIFANIRENQAAVAEVIDMLIELRQTWAEAELLVRTGAPAPVAESAVAA